MPTGNMRTTSIQMIAKPVDGLPVMAQGIIEGTNDRINWFPIARLTASGNGVQADGGPFDTLWDSMRFRLDVSEGCSVDVFLTQREG